MKTYQRFNDSRKSREPLLLIALFNLVSERRQAGPIHTGLSTYAGQSMGFG